VANYVECEVAVEGLSEPARRVLLAAGGGEYRKQYGGFGFSNSFVFNSYDPTWCSFGIDYPQVDSDTPTPAEIDAAILAMAARVEAKRVQAESEKAEAEERRQAEAEAKAEKTRRLAEARELLKDELSQQAASGQRHSEARDMLADFLAFVPQDAKRGALKAMAADTVGCSVETLRKQIEDANPYSTDVFDEDDDESEDE
jgi:hypothetical protein